MNGPLLNGIESSGEEENGEEKRDMDSIGGAELTEIPWLRNQHNTNGGSPGPVGNTANGGLVGDLRTESTRVIDGPNGAGSVETVTVNMNGVSSHTPQSDSSTTSTSTSTGHGITQGELLRQEQEAGIVPVPSSPVRNGPITRSGTAAAAAANRAVVGEPPPEGEVLAVVEENEPVHARGPDVIGMEDMGPQAPGSGLAGGLDLEGALGRRGEGENLAGAVGRAEQGKESVYEKDVDGDGDGDVVIADADGVVEGEEVAKDASGTNVGVDAVDSTAL